MESYASKLKHDHQVILRVVAGMNAVAEMLESGKQLDPAVLADLAQFLRIFAGACQRRKEEAHLFPLLNDRADAVLKREIQELERDHRAAGELVERLASLAAAYRLNPLVARQRIVDVLYRLAELYPLHIWKEDYLLLPAAQQMLTRDDQEALEDGMAEVEANIGSDVHHAFESLADRLEAVVQYRASGACPLCAASA